MTTPRVEVRQWSDRVFGCYVFDRWSHPLGDFAGVAEGDRDDALAVATSVLRWRRDETLWRLYGPVRTAGGADFVHEDPAMHGGAK